MIFQRAGIHTSPQPRGRARQQFKCTPYIPPSLLIPYPPPPLPPSLPPSSLPTPPFVPAPPSLYTSKFQPSPTLSFSLSFPFPQYFLYFAYSIFPPFFLSLPSHSIYISLSPLSPSFLFPSPSRDHQLTRTTQVKSWFCHLCLNVTDGLLISCSCHGNE